MRDTVRLPETLQSFGHGEFEAMLQGELRQQHWQVPLEDFCRSGAWPDFEEELRVSVHRAEMEGDTLQITAFVSFDPTVPSYCADHHHVEPADGFLRIAIDRETAEARFETEPLGT